MRPHSRSGSTRPCRAIAAKGKQAEVMVCDVRNLSVGGSGGADCTSQHGRVDILVNNAGIGGFGNPLHELPADDWDRVLEH